MVPLDLRSACHGPVVRWLELGLYMSRDCDFALFRECFIQVFEFTLLEDEIRMSYPWEPVLVSRGYDPWEQNSRSKVGNKTRPEWSLLRVGYKLRVHVEHVDDKMSDAGEVGCQHHISPSAGAMRLNRCGDSGLPLLEHDYKGVAAEENIQPDLAQPPADPQQWDQDYGSPSCSAKPCTLQIRNPVFLIIGSNCLRGTTVEGWTGRSRKGDRAALPLLRAAGSTLGVAHSSSRLAFCG